MTSTSDEKTKQSKPKAAREPALDGKQALGVIVADEDLSTVALRTTTLNDGTTWASLSAYLREGAIAEILDHADSSWEWGIEGVREFEILQRWEKEDSAPKTGVMVWGRLSLWGYTRTGVGYDSDPRAAATFAFKDAAEKWGVGRFLAAPRYSMNLKFPDKDTFKRFIAKRPSWAEVVAYKEGKQT